MKVVDINTGIVRDVIEDDYHTDNGKFDINNFTQRGMVANDKPTNNITVNISGVQQSDDELAEKVARRIVEEIDNSW